MRSASAEKSAGRVHEHEVGAVPVERRAGREDRDAALALHGVGVQMRVAGVHAAGAANGARRGKHRLRERGLARVDVRQKPHDRLPHAPTSSSFSRSPLTRLPNKATRTAAPSVNSLLEPQPAVMPEERHLRGRDCQACPARLLRDAGPVLDELLFKLLGLGMTLPHYAPSSRSAPRAAHGLKIVHRVKTTIFLSREAQNWSFERDERKGRGGADVALDGTARARDTGNVVTPSKGPGALRTR